MQYGQRALKADIIREAVCPASHADNGSSTKKGFEEGSELVAA